MPPEPLPWDRKDFFKERKYHNNSNSHQQNERSSVSLLGSSGGNGGGSLTRWRDYHTSLPHQSRELDRWGSADFRRLPGHGKQGGWHLFSEESGHGYAPSISSDTMPEAEFTRISVSRGDGKYIRNSRENRISFGQRDWNGYAWDTSNGYATTAGRPHDVNCDQRLVNDMLMHPSHPQSDFVNPWDHVQLNDHHDNKIGGVNGLGTGQRCERESSLDGKIKWTRSGSVSSRGSGLSYSNSSKSMGGVDSSEGKTDLMAKNATSVQSPCGDAATFVTSGARSEETTSRKKPRIGWGEGLAKYEKKKVEVPYASVNRDALFNSSSNSEPLQSLSPHFAEKSPRIIGFPDCASPATPSSVACSSSLGVEEKAFCKAVNVDNDGNLCSSPSVGSQNHLEGFLFNLKKLDTNTFDFSLIELLQSDDPSLVDSSFVSSTVMNKLLEWKGNVLKTLETTEAEIDSLESELRAMKSASGSTSPCPATSTLVVEDGATQFNGQGIVYNLIAQPAPLEIDCDDVTAEKMPECSRGLEEIHADGKDDDIDSPGSATSKYVELSSFVKPFSPSDTIKNGESFKVLEAIQTTNIEGKCNVHGSLGEGMAGVSTCGRDGMLTESKKSAPVHGDCCPYPDEGNTLFDVILGANKESMNEAFEVFNKLLPRDRKDIDVSGVADAWCGQHNSLIKEKFAKRRQFLRFKERVLTLKLKAFQHLWKEDLRLLSIRKYRAMTQKKCELSLRTTYTGYHKYRSSIRSQFSSPAGNLSLLPTTEVINFTSKLLSDFRIKVYRNSLKMPALILDKKDKIMSKFISSNGLVEDPCAIEKERTMINPWTSEEREIFMGKLATFGKDFRKIASFLDHKTIADCVEFYYKNHKSDCFQKLKKKQDLSKQGKTSANLYMVTSGKRNRKINAASLDILGEASEMAATARADSFWLLNSGRISSGGSGDTRTSLGNDGIIERSSSLDDVGSERETAAADVLAGICGSLSAEAMSSCITSSIDPEEGRQYWKPQKVDSVMRQPSKSDITLDVDDDLCSDESCDEMNHSDWTDEEKSIFIHAVLTYGKDFSMVAQRIGTRSRDQCKVFFSKSRKCLGLDLMCTERGNVDVSVNDDANSGESDAEDPCVLQTTSVICGDELGSKMDLDLPPHVTKSKEEESCLAGGRNSQTDLNKSEDDNGMAFLDHKDSKAVKPLMNDAFMSESRSLELESSSVNVVDNQSESVLNGENTVGRDRVAEQGKLLVSADPCLSSSYDVEERNDVGAETASKGFAEEEHELMLPEKSLNEARYRNCNVDASGEREMVKDSNTTTGSAFDLYGNTSSRSVSLKLDSMGKRPVISSQKNSLCDGTFIPRDSTVVQFEKTINPVRLSSTLDRHSKDKSVHKCVGNNDYGQHLSGHSIVKHVGSSILNGYPVPVSTKKEMNEDVNCRQFSGVQSILKSNGNTDGPYLACHLRKCNSLIPHSSISEPQLLSRKIELTSDQSPHAHSLSYKEKPCKNGDVKLFGKILGYPLTTSSSHENGENGHHYKPSSKTSNPKFNAHHSADGGAALVEFDRNKYAGLEDVPVRSYGFWDGNRIQTGFSSLPNSAILLAKYPAAFSSCPISSSNAIAVLPPRNTSDSKRVVDYQVYEGCDGPKIPPFSLDMKQRQEFLLSEMQRQNRFEALSSLQQQGKGMVGVDVGGGGIVVRGGSSTGVSDPVAAMKMHYAKASEQGGSNIR